jgi:hypothetical protein
MSYWELAFKWGWCTVDQLRTVVFYKEITQDVFKQITGEDYEEENAE